MVRLTREVRFSVDRDWAGHVDEPRPVTNSWAGWPSAVGLVPFLRLRATLVGEPHPATGYLCNIALIDGLLRRHAIPHTASALKASGWRLSAEQLLLTLWPRLEAETPGGAVLEQLELLATPFLRFTIDRRVEPAAAAAPGGGRRIPEMVLLTQQFEFSAAHRLHCPELSDDENRRTFGKCNNPNGHGHNYVLEVTLKGQPDSGHGAVLPVPHFEQVVKERVVDVLDHKHLNDDTEQFRRMNPSVENIARVIWDMLVSHVAPAALHAVRVYETPKTWAECLGE